ncbi:uncharacterized protein TRIADDRAFT_62392 [Trichoplax adhaerens]|uniref:EGF-like domain-containing protein n=1 Tax=Trichoplax adhaerens TaxID=10228 RepID=B3SDN5_TRIAD|nr:hypothetical protein TRIADDRAFT_62392 [Trichoplax adhaerens]EDV19178.1 hypothetical protein TRIADDRAFT_62392 [Trichoplax adhaerens]|eukprot:XP_002118356.1 hypothetical protein TRIADDRAFT_62392 [Trichoplax adhaerens]
MANSFYHNTKLLYRGIEPKKRLEAIVPLSECRKVGLNCSSFATCLNRTENETFYLACQCLDGFDGDGFSCQDINECNNSQLCSLPHQICINTNGSYYCKCDQQTSNGSYYQHNCTKCQLACKNGGGYCRLDKKQKPYCLCPSGFVDRDCGTRKPVITSNIIAGMIIGFAALVIVIILVSVFYYLRWKSDKRNRQGYDEASTATLKSNPSSSKDTDRKSSTRLSNKI